MSPGAGSSGRFSWPSWEQWGFSRPQQGWPVLSVHPVLNGLIGNWNSAPGKLTGLLSEKLPRLQDRG